MDTLGGAAKVANDLFHAYRVRGHESWLAVGHKLSADADILAIPNHETRQWMSRQVQNLDRRLAPPAKPKTPSRTLLWLRQVKRFGASVSQPHVILSDRLGLEQFSFSGTTQLLRMTPQQPDVVHCHNLHGGYFDLRRLPWLSEQVPTFLTLHDAWLLSGHCAHSFHCDRWLSGCGHCPDLTIYPAVRRDATASNWQRKRKLYSKSRLYVATPSRWLMDKVERSILAPAVIEGRVIPNGVDLSIFRHGDKTAIRSALGIPSDAKVLLFVAQGIRQNIWKDYQTMQAAVALVAEHLRGSRLLFLAVGEDAPTIQIGKAELRFVPYQTDPRAVASYYQAADVYVHAAAADNFPLVVLEALACGTPVVATAVGGIPEQVKGLRFLDQEIRHSLLNKYGISEATGILVPPNDVSAMAGSITLLLTDEGVRRTLGDNAARNAQAQFDLTSQVDEYLAWYRRAAERWRRQSDA